MLSTRGKQLISIVLIISVYIRPHSAQADEGFCTGPPGDSQARVQELEALLHEKEVEIGGLNEKIGQLNKDVEKRDEKGMHLMKSYKACSDRMDDIADKEADQAWKPDADKLVQDLTWLHTENRKSVEDLEKCEKKKKKLNKKYNALKKETTVPCLTQKTLVQTISGLLTDKTHAGVFEAYGTCLLNTWNEKSSAAAPADESQDNLSKCQRVVGELKSSLEKRKEDSDSCSVAGEVEALRGQVLMTQEKLEHRQDLVLEAMFSQQGLEEQLFNCKKELGAIDRKTDSDDNDNAETKDNTESTDESQPKPEPALYSSKSGKPQSCQEQLKEAKEEAEKYLRIMRSDDDYVVKCRLQKQNLKVSRWFIKKWYFRELGRNTELLKQINQLQEKVSSKDTVDPDTCKAEEEKIKRLMDANDKLEQRSTHCEDHIFPDRERDDLRKAVANCKEARDELKTEKDQANEDLDECRASNKGQIKGEGYTLCQESLKVLSAEKAEAESQLAHIYPDYNIMKKEFDQANKDLDECRTSNKGQIEGEGYTLCQESLKFVSAEKADVESQLAHIYPEYKKMKKEFDPLLEAAETCTSKKSECEYKERGYKMVTDQLESDLEKEKNKFKSAEESATAAIYGAETAKLNFSFALIFVVLLLTYNVYNVLVTRLFVPDTKGKSKAPQRPEGAKESARAAERMARRSVKKSKTS